MASCEAQAYKGTGTGTCGRKLDRHGQCDRAGGHVQEDAFLDESLEATTMHEPPAYPADKLEWSELLRGIGNVD